jgi:alpha-1,3-mannosyltransferase
VKYPPQGRCRVKQGDAIRALKILHVCRRFAPFSGGTERYVRDLAVAQSRLGHGVTVLTLDRDTAGHRSGRLPARARLDDVDILRVPGWGRPQLAVTFRPDRLYQAVADHDVTHLHDVRFGLATVALAARFRHRPWILHTHGLIFHTSPGSRAKRLAMRLGIGPLLRLGGANVIASSESDRQLLLRDAPALADRTQTFDNAIPLDPLLQTPRTPLPGRIVSIGRIVATKRLSRLLGALDRIRDEPWTLDIAGEPDESEVDRLEAMASGLGFADRVRISGGFSDERLAEMLGQASVAAFPSGGEGFGIALLEAMAAGVPICAQRIPAHELLLGPALVHLLVDFDQPDQAAGRIRELLQLDPAGAAQLSGQLRERASGYGIDRLRDEIEGLYARLGLAGTAVRRGPT